MTSEELARFIYKAIRVNGILSLLNRDIHVSEHNWQLLIKSSWTDANPQQEGGACGMFMGGRVFVSENLDNNTCIVDDLRIPIFPS
jgi:hypothetical protein